jgi:hypothetical protein
VRSLLCDQTAQRQSTKWHLNHDWELGCVFMEYGIGYYRLAFGLPLRILTVFLYRWQ